MRFIEEMAERMDDELDGAEEYAEGAPLGSCLIVGSLMLRFLPAITRPS